MGTPKGSLACRCRSLLNAVLSNAVLQKQSPPTDRAEARTCDLRFRGAYASRSRRVISCEGKPVDQGIRAVEWRVRKVPV